MAPPTPLAPASAFARHIGADRMTVWAHHRNLGLHRANWELVDEYNVESGVELSGRSTVIRRGQDGWFLVDDYEEIHVHGENAHSTGLD